MIVFALIALGWWLAAPDRFTAAARTATGTGLKAAGTGARAHWTGGRDGRKAVRTDRRDRWHAKGGWWRKMLGLEHGAVVTGKAVRGAGKLAGAAVKPVPGAVREGWRKGQDRHRARTAGRSVPVALDPPWWRRQQPPLDYPPHTCSRCGRTGADDEVFGSYYAVGDVRLCKSCVQWLDRRYPEGWPDDPAEVTEFSQGKRWPSMTVSPRLDPRTGQPIPAPVPNGAGRDSGTAAKDSPGPAAPVLEDSPTKGSPVTTWRHIPFEYVDDHEVRPTGTPFFPDAPDGPSLDSEADIRARNPELARINPDPLTEGQRRFWHLRDRGYPGALDQDGWPAPDFHTGAIVNPMPYLRQPATTSPAAAGAAPIKVWKSSAECGGCGADADYTTDTACPNCGAGFTSIQSVYPQYADAIRRERPDLPVTTTVEGDPMFENEANYSQAGKMRRDQARHRSPASPGTSGATPTELRTHVAVQDFAQQIDRMSEASDFVVVAEQAREVGAKSRAGGFGAEMDSAVDELESVAKRFAQDVDSLRAQAHHLTKTSLSVQGS